MGDRIAVRRRRRDDLGVHFTGSKHGAAFSPRLSRGNMFVFPRRTDTFRLVILDALACGKPVAAFPVTGPKDVLANAGKVGSMNEDLRKAALDTLDADRTACRVHAERNSWRACAEVFLSHPVPINDH